MALITEIPAKKSMSVLTSDLIGNINFNASQTIPAMDISSNKYNEGMSLYLQKLGVTQLDEEYNAAVKQFELQLEEQEIAIKLQANMAAETAANIAVEAQPGLGTGASAVASEGRQNALGAVYEGIENQVAETYQDGITSISEEYQSALESILGEYDPATGTFANLENYEAMSNVATTAMAKVIALMIDPNVDTYNTDSYLGVLKAAGYIEDISTGNEITMTDAGQRIIDSLVNSVNSNAPQATLGGKSLGYALAEQMAKTQYSGDEHWESLSDSKREELITQYASWIYNNEDTLRLTAWDLYTTTDDGYILDTEFSSELSGNFYSEGVDDKSGISTINLAHSDVSDCSQGEFNIIKAKLISGEISNGSYFTFQSGKAYENDKFYYVENGMVYKTSYTVDNPPPVINVDQATVYSFGRYQDTGKSKSGQDNWVKEIIDFAKADRIPDGTYIQFNYGVSADNYKTGWYEYNSGRFLRVSSDTKVVAKDKYNGTFVTTDLASVASTNVFISSNVIHNAGYRQYLDKYLDW